MVDLSKLTPQELKLFKMYGKLPSKRDLLKHKMQERKYFDSGDYALRKAGVIKKDDVMSSNSSNNMPVTNPSGLRESIIRRRLSNSSPNNSNSDNNSIERKGSISSGPPPSRSPIR